MGEGLTPGSPPPPISDKPIPFSWARLPPRQNGVISHSCQPLAGTVEGKEGVPGAALAACSAGRADAGCGSGWGWGVLADA